MVRLTFYVDQLGSLAQMLRNMDIVNRRFAMLRREDERRIGMSSVYSSYIKRMRMCANGNCKGCTYQYEGLTNTEECKEDLLYDAAKQLEDADKCNARLVKKCKEMEKRIAELESWSIHLLKQLPKECEFKRNADRIPNARNRYCTQCGSYISDEEWENHSVRYCYYCGSKVKGEQE